MRTLKLLPALLLCLPLARIVAQEPPWNAAIKECDRACLVAIMDGYMAAVFRHDPKAVPPLAADVRMRRTPDGWTSGKGCCADAPPGMLQNPITEKVHESRRRGVRPSGLLRSRG